MMYKYAIMLNPPLWYRAMVRVRNSWKNLSRFWSQKEQRIQAAVNATQHEIGQSLVDPDYDFSNSIEEDVCFIADVVPYEVP